MKISKSISKAVKLSDVGKEITEREEGSGYYHLIEIRDKSDTIGQCCYGNWWLLGDGYGKCEEEILKHYRIGARIELPEMFTIGNRIIFTEDTDEG